MGTSFVSVVGICACCTSFVKFSSVMPASCSAEREIQTFVIKVVHKVGCVDLDLECSLRLVNLYCTYSGFELGKEDAA